MMDGIDVEKKYLTHQSNYVIHYPTMLLAFLGFLITINIAYYTGVYLIGIKPEENIWAFSNLRIFITLLIIFINFCLTIIILREHSLSKIIRGHIYDKIFTDKKIEDVMLRELINDAKKAPFRNVTWYMILCLLSVINIIPIAYLVTYLTVNKLWLSFSLGSHYIWFATILILGSLLFCAIVTIILQERKNKY